ncbi:MarR family winged helix-turn-helix transcriptional regulator [Kibdelosporangium phytohabitans]|uniref:HTH marR-type domain-containing protein n=1 Tax=Kibdelosporangium phytohabitans TaxID=860235 RepID=A0A0N7F3U1_9PSEU|nr:MarR family winged helix-turn-helix transcriptional regulator [Kibdelosporangium phytohabitans]ALG09575.1 hypothetical protein AOZ06_24115 [Kibdelosporangium phytohabitans]MBE1469097.1 DNA-binding MarR family transcriptional regulator [Kibdelosporangium phytohabitans]
MEEDVWTGDALGRVTAWTLVRAYHAVAHEFTKLFDEHGLTPVQFGVLAQLAATPELLQAELARSVLIRPQSMAAVITQLVDRGLLERRGTGGRGRPVPIRLTDEGRQLLGQASAAVRRYNEPATLGLESYEAGMLNALLHKVIDAHTGNS